MRIYVAGPWDYRHHAKHLMTQLEERGHTITWDWTVHDEPNASDEYLGMCAVNDVSGVRDCDAYVGLFTESFGKGSVAEFGMALILDKTVYVIGDKIEHCIFYFHPHVQKFPDSATFLAHLDIVTKYGDVVGVE